MLKKYIDFFLVIFFFLVPILLNAVELKGTGYGTDEDEAKRNALSDLSSQIEVEVKSEINSIVSEFTKGTNTQSKDFSQSIIQLKSELPILGVNYIIKKNNDKVYKVIASASLNSETSGILYEEKLKQLKDEIDSYNSALKNKNDDISKEDILNNLISDIIQFNKYKIVSIFLKVKNIPLIEINQSELKAELINLEKNIDTLDKAAKKISSGISEKNIYIYPPTTNGSHEITQFAEAVSNYISKYIQSSKSLDYAQYSMRGKYEILKDGIELTYNLIDRDFNTSQIRIVKLLPEAYKNYEINPKTLDFDELLYQGYVVSNDYKIEITTNKGSFDLLFYNEEEVELIVKINNPGYFFIIGHILKNTEKYSYLLELYKNTNSGKRKFVRYIGIDDVNKWISLGKFEVIRPFGIESLQVIASNIDLINNLPKFALDDSGYYLMINDQVSSTDDPKAAVEKTRGLKPKADDKVKTCETVLMFTTSQR